MSKIILTGGGTAGHCIPNLALIPYLKERFDKIDYIGSFDGIEKTIIKNTDIPYYSVTTTKFIRKFSLSNLSIPYKLIKGITESKKILNELKPDVIFSKGGYVSLPVVIAGKSLDIPVIAHESDYSIGLTNKISSLYADIILTSFPETSKKIKNSKYVGSPIRQNKPSLSKNEILNSMKFTGKKPVLLVTGGSSGALSINNIIRNVLTDILPRFDIIHICGKGNIDKNIKKPGYYQIEFTDNMENYFEIADICISRCGSNTAFELLNKKIPTIFIPLPKGISRGDQVENAEYFQRQGLSYVLNQDNLTKNSLIYAINSVYSNRFNIIRKLSLNSVNDASSEIVDIISSYID